MPRQSTLKRLPAEIKERIGALLSQGRTLKEIIDALAALDVQVSRSSLHRYKPHIDKIGERLRRSRETAEVLVERFGQGLESKTARLNIELLQDTIMQIQAQAEDGGDDEKGPGTPMGAMLLAKAVDHLAKAARNDAELTIKIREQAAAEARAKAAETAANAGKQLGLNAEQAAFIRAEILGIEVQR